MIPDTASPAARSYCTELTPVVVESVQQSQQDAGAEGAGRSGGAGGHCQVLGAEGGGEDCEVLQL